MSGAVLLEEILRAAVTRGGSDIHLKVPAPPALRIDGRLERLDEFAGVKPGVAESVLAVMLASLPHSSKQNEFERTGDVDFAYAHPGLGRFRVNAFRQRGSVSMVIRVVPFGVPHADELGISASVLSLLEHQDGLIIVTGAPGSGVTTTLAALVDHLNGTVVRNVLTFEDPIEVLHADRQCAVSQREIGLDTPSFAQGLDRALRHDSDVIAVSALPDLASVEAALALAQTGVLVLVAVRSPDVAGAIRRLTGLYPDDRQRQARAELARTLRGVVVQRLLPRADGAGRCLASEVLPGTTKVRQAIEDGAPASEIAAHIDSQANVGGVSLNESLAELVVRGTATLESALGAARDAAGLERLVAARMTLGE